MKISLDNTGKRFNREWIFRGLNYQIESAERIAILGANGSGKSTLLQTIAGYITPTKGIISYSESDHLIVSTVLFQSISIAAPYMQVYEDMTLKESIIYHNRFKPFLEGCSIDDLIGLLYLEGQENKQIKYFSSGMKQRLRLGLAILSNAPLLLLDEPTSNLDRKGIVWYRNMIETYSKDRTIIVSSNHLEEEMDFCSRQIVMEDYKS